MNEELAKQAILDNILNCSSCNDIGKKRLLREGLDKIEYLKKNLPGLDYVVNRAVYFIFSNGLTTGAEETKATLENWLYSKNVNGVTNYAILQEGVRRALVDGCCGIRVYNNSLYAVKRGYYANLTQRTDGIEMVVAYVIREDGEKIPEQISIGDDADYKSLEDVRRQFNESRLILLNSSDFINLRNDTSSLFGDSPLLRDELRLSLLVSEYEHLNYDLDFDGPGRIVLHVDDGISTSDNASSTQLINQSGGAMSKRNDKALEEATRIATQIRNSSSDNVITLSNAFDKEITHLPRVTKSTDDFFRDWLKNEGLIIAQDIGISPSLVEAGDVSGNVSMEKIIDNAVTHDIVPMRENYASQFSDVISAILGVPKVYFDDYKLSQVENINNVRKMVANMIRDISVAQKNAPSDDKAELSEELTFYLKNSLRDEDGNIAELNDKR